MCWLPEADKPKSMLIAACINRYQSVSEGRELSLAKEGHCVLSIFKMCLVITHPSHLPNVGLASVTWEDLNGGQGLFSPGQCSLHLLPGFQTPLYSALLVGFAFCCFNGVGIVISASS